jgi:hypothetical protein
LWHLPLLAPCFRTAFVTAHGCAPRSYNSVGSPRTASYFISGADTRYGAFRANVRFACLCGTGTTGGTVAFE